MPDVPTSAAADPSRRLTIWTRAEWMAVVAVAVGVVTLGIVAAGPDAVFQHEPPPAAQQEPYRLLVDINRDPWQRMTLVTGIGERTAQAIVEYREEHGPFGSVDELVNVPGIGERRVQQWRPYLRPIEPADVVKPAPNTTAAGE